MAVRVIMSIKHMVQSRCFNNGLSNNCLRTPNVGVTRVTDAQKRFGGLLSAGCYSSDAP